MKQKWNRLITIKKAYDDAPKKPGIYVIRRKTPVNRINRLDPCGVLYIGKSKHLQKRLKQFWDVSHLASWFLWEKRTIASHILDIDCKTDEVIDEELGRLKVRMAEIPTDGDLERAERAVLFAYALKFGELPPLNANLPRRSKKAPSKGDLSWGRKGIK